MVYGIRVSNRRELDRPEETRTDIMDARKLFNEAKATLPSGYCVSLFCRNGLGQAATLERHIVN